MTSWRTRRTQSVAGRNKSTYLEMRSCNDKVQIARAVNATVIALEDAPRGYQDFDKGATKKYVLNPNGLIAT